MSFEKLIRKDLLDLSPYASARSEKLIGDVWLNANELPWDNTQTLNLENINRYPEQQPDQLIERLAAYHKVDTNKILVTRGSDEGIDLLLRLFCNARIDSIAALDPTFGMYKICAKIQGVRYIKLELNKDNDYSIDIETIAKQLESNTRILFLCHPNNPTGNLLNKTKVLQLCKELESNCIVVIDEAYIEFAQDDGFVQYISEYKNLVILRTMSKAFGLAAARIGILISNDSLTGWLKKLLAPYPISKPAALEAINALSSHNISQVSDQIKIILNERHKLRVGLDDLDIVNQIWSSEANFLLVEFAYNVMDLCLENGIVIRSMAKIIGCDKTYRITVGTPEENLKVIRVLAKLSLVNVHE